MMLRNKTITSIAVGLALVSAKAVALNPPTFPWGANAQTLTNAEIQWVLYWGKRVNEACFELDGVDIGCQGRSDITFKPNGQQPTHGESSGSFPIPEGLHPGEGEFSAKVTTCTYGKECSSNEHIIRFSSGGTAPDSGGGNQTGGGYTQNSSFSLLPAVDNALAAGLVSERPTNEELARKQQELINSNAKVDTILAQLDSSQYLPGRIKLDLTNKSSLPQNVKNIMSIFTQEDWNYLFPMRKPVYTYKGFLEAAAKFPKFCNELLPNSVETQAEMCAKELSTTFAHFTQEVGAHLGNNYNYNGEILPEYRQGLYYIEEAGCEATEEGVSVCVGYNVNSTPNVWQGSSWPSYPNAQYYGRGAKQLSYNYNYAPFSQIMYGNDQVLLENPHLVATDPYLAIGSAIYFYMLPRSPKPSIHDAVIGRWVPNQADLSYNRESGFGVTINIINGGVECGGTEPAAGVPSQPRNREIYYEGFARYFNIWDSLGLANEKNDCWKMGTFGDESSAAVPTFWDRQDWVAPATGQLVSYESGPNSLFTENSYAEFVKKTYYHGRNGAQVFDINGNVGLASNAYDPYTNYQSNTTLHWNNTGDVVLFDTTRTEVVSKFSTGQTIDNLVGLTTGHILITSNNRLKVYTSAGEVADTKASTDKVLAVSAHREGFRNNKLNVVTVVTKDNVTRYSVSEDGTLNIIKQAAGSFTEATSVAGNSNSTVIATPKQTIVLDSELNAFSLDLADNTSKVVNVVNDRFMLVNDNASKLTVVSVQNGQANTLTVDTGLTASEFDIVALQTGGAALVGKSESSVDVLFISQDGTEIHKEELFNELLLVKSSEATQLSAKVLLNGTLLVSWEDKGKNFVKQIAAPVNTDAEKEKHQVDSRKLVYTALTPIAESKGMEISGLTHNAGLVSFSFDTSYSDLDYFYIRLLHNGKYVASCKRATCYSTYSTFDNGIRTVSRKLQTKNGDVLKAVIYRNNHKGEILAEKELVVVSDPDVNIKINDLSYDVKSGNIFFSFDNSYSDLDYFYIRLFKNDKYIASCEGNTCYYSYPSVANNVKTVRRKISLQRGDELKVVSYRYNKDGAVLAEKKVIVSN